MTPDAGIDLDGLEPIPAIARRHLHLVYADPGLAGALRNLELLRAAAGRERAPSALRAFAFGGDTYEHTSFLCWADVPVRLHLYSRESPIARHEALERVLSVADAVVYIADVAHFRLEASVERWESVRDLVASTGRDPATFPFVGQLNQPREHPAYVEVTQNIAVLTRSPAGPATLPPIRLASLDEVRALVLPRDAPWVEASTYEGGRGVRETLRVALRLAAEASGAGAERPLLPEIRDKLIEDGIDPDG